MKRRIVWVTVVTVAALGLGCQPIGKRPSKKKKPKVETTADTATTAPETDTATTAPETDTATAAPETDTATAAPETAATAAAEAETATAAAEAETETPTTETDTATAATETEAATATTAATPAVESKKARGRRKVAQTEPAPPPSGDIPAPPDVAAPPADAKRTPSGLAYKVLEPGEGGEHPGPKDIVEVHYTGWTTDGTMFDSSVKRGQTVEFPLNGVIKGWGEGVQLMTVGERTRFWIPEELAYKGAPNRPQGMLVFDIQLFGIKKAPEDIPAPPDVASPPADAKRTDSGLAYKILTPKPEGKQPTASSLVRVHYTGWTTDGKMFDSSVLRGRPAVFPLNRVIPGWTEGLQLMHVGEKARLWIPEALAYRGARGAPQGMLVFDVELLDVRP